MTGVLVVGSLHYDVMVAAPTLPRLGETVTGRAWFPKFGGKGGNQAVAAARAGAPTRFLGAVGPDDFGAFLRAGLRAGGVDDRFLRAVDAPSGMSVAIVEAGGDYGAVIVSGANLALDPSWLEDAALWDGIGAVLLQNEIPEAMNRAAAAAARARGARAILNAAPFRPMDEGLLAAVDTLVVNALEAEALGAPPVASLADAARAAAALAGFAAEVVVTAGPAGAAAQGPEGTFALPAPHVAVAASHGAGDAFLGAFAAARAAGLESALAAGVAAAARHVAGG